MATDVHEANPPRVNLIGTQPQAQTWICAPHNRRYFKLEDFESHLTGRSHKKDGCPHCGSCELSFRTEFQLFRHVSGFHGRHRPSDTGGGPWACDFHNRYYREEVDYARHLAKDCHKMGGKAFCPKLGLTFSSEFELGYYNLHGCAPPLGQAVYTCAFHNVRNVGILEFSRHIAGPKHQRGGKSYCSACKCTFPSQYELQGHITLWHGEKDHPACGVCGKAFKTKHKLEKHERLMAQYVRAGGPDNGVPRYAQGYQQHKVAIETREQREVLGLSEPQQEARDGGRASLERNSPVVSQHTNDTIETAGQVLSGPVRSQEHQHAELVKIEPEAERVNGTIYNEGSSNLHGEMEIFEPTNQNPGEQKLKIFCCPLCNNLCKGETAHLSHLTRAAISGKETVGHWELVCELTRRRMSDVDDAETRSLEFCSGEVITSMLRNGLARCPIQGCGRLFAATGPLLIHACEYTKHAEAHRVFAHQLALFCLQEVGQQLKPPGGNHGFLPDGPLPESVDTCSLPQ
ncbi:hypothetical protein FN846DRAFT_922089 [Sphaerosporella brunnea]|uniref:C2H2-type domain-containing protein n=1 Tax=Sphaerosporella brunnea TaxID=1250544 RepID=A0A5J5EJD2_9PEZI|nr:hypothetical protein FN846DRAFT_922089 [Sphaerosporella brunnea]